MKKILTLLLAVVLVLAPITALAEEEVYEGYKIEEFEQELYVNGEKANVTTYFVKNWDLSGEKPRENKQIVIKLRDLAALFTDTDAKFDVSYNGETEAVEIVKGEDYEPMEADLTELDLENVHIEPSTSLVLIDDEEVEISGVKINNHNYYRISVLRKALNNFRFRSDFEDSDKSYIETDSESDIELFDAEKFEALLDEHDYTLVFNWGPWCYYSRRAIPMMEELQDFYAENDIDVQIVGIVNDYANYTNEEISVLFSDEEAPWINLAATDEAYEYLEAKLGSDINFFPLRFLLDKEGNLVGSEFFDYYDEIYEEYLEANEKTEDDLTDEDEEIIEKRAYEEFFDRATGVYEKVEEEVEEIVEDAEEKAEELEEKVEEKAEELEEEVEEKAEEKVEELEEEVEEETEEE